MRQYKRKQTSGALSTALLLSMLLSPMGTAALAADLTAPITITNHTHSTYDNFTLSSLGAGNFALKTASGINSPTDITFNGNVNLNLTDTITSFGGVINTSSTYGSNKYVDINMNGAEFNLSTNVNFVFNRTDRFAGVYLNEPANLNVSAKTNINIQSSDTSASYATYGAGMANFANDLTINMQGGQHVYGIGSHYKLSGANNNITISTANSERIGGIYNANSSNRRTVRSEIAAGTTTNIKVTDTGTNTQYVTGINDALLHIGQGAVINLDVHSYSNNRITTYLGMENGTNGLTVKTEENNNFANALEIEKGAQLNITVAGLAVDIAPGMTPDSNIAQNTGLGGATGISSSGKAMINGDVNINILSQKGVGIKVISYNVDANRIASIGDMEFNGNTIVNAAGGYALLSATASESYRNSLDDKSYWRFMSNISINEQGGSLVQLTGDIDHMSMFNSHFKINLDTQGSFLRGSAMLSNIRQSQANNVEGNKTDINLANGATWYMTGKSDLNTTGNSIVNKLSFANKGLLDMTADDTLTTHTYERLNVNELGGNDGRILMNTNLQDSFDKKDVKAEGDRIYIEKYKNQYEIDHPDVVAPTPIANQLSAGTHVINIKDASLLKGIAAEGYLLLVEDHTKGQAVFVGGELEKGGIFKYKPIITNQDPGAGSGYSNIPIDSNNWYLTGFERAGVQEETVINAGLAESRYIAYMNEQDTLVKRLGELRQSDKEKGIWARVRGANNSVGGFGLNRNSYVSTHLGYDWKLQEKEGATDKRYVGVAFNHTNNNFDYAAGATGKGQSNVLTVYGTRLGDKGHYLDLVGKIGRMSNDYKYQDQKATAKNWFYSLSAEYGRSIIKENGWYYEPQVQFTFGRINGADYSGSGINVEADGITSAILRGGILAGRKFNQDKQDKLGSYYAKVFYSYEFGGNVKADMTDAFGDKFDFSHSYKGGWVTVGVGTALNLNKKTNIYLDVEKAFGGKVSGGWAWQGGVRWRF